MLIILVLLASLSGSVGDVHPTGDQEVAGSTPPGRHQSFVEIDNEIYFL